MCEVLLDTVDVGLKLAVCDRVCNAVLDTVGVRLTVEVCEREREGVRDMMDVAVPVDDGEHVWSEMVSVALEVADRVGKAV